MERIKRYFERPGVRRALGAMVALALAAGLAWLVVGVLDSGRADVARLARANGLCRAAGCEDGRAAVAARLAGAYGLAPGAVEWCVGTDLVARTRVQRGGLLKAPALWAMRLPCGTMFADERLEKL